MLAHGIEPYELKPGEKADVPSRLTLCRGSSAELLHAKVLVFDRRDVFVGSFNFDPRSRHLNTEDGLIVHSAELARDAAELLYVFLVIRSLKRLRATSGSGYGP
ncbi:MAG TPA: phospholipase D-like domain-containing protein [Geminicoccaceae bacterium]|nr:phospholipase D-like domain-containing protein [Geminicoccaceae bacterium]